jgi:hypothetical protein
MIPFKTNKSCTMYNESIQTQLDFGSGIGCLHTNFPCSVSFQGMLEGSVRGGLTEGHSILVP